MFFRQGPEQTVLLRNNVHKSVLHTELLVQIKMPFNFLSPSVSILLSLSHTHEFELCMLLLLVKVHH